MAETVDLVIIGAGCSFVRTGSLIMAGKNQEYALRNAVGLMQAVGLDIRFVNLAELNTLEPYADLEDLMAVSYAAQTGYADPALTTQAFAQAEQRMGVDIQSGRSVLGLQNVGRLIIGLGIESGPISAAVVIIAAGSWSGRLLNSLGVEIGLQPARHPVAWLRRSYDFDPAHQSVLDLANGIYARPDTGSLTIFGSINTKVGYNPADPDETFGCTPNEYTLWTAERLVRRYPVLETSSLYKGWSGILMVSPDWPPVVGAVAEFSGLYCASCFSGHGFQISPAVGDLLAGQIAGEHAAIQLLPPFHPSRFVEDEKIMISRERISLGLSGNI